MLMPPAPRIRSLDGVRAVAVLLVVAYHLAPQLLPTGLIGVDVFFVLSGYLITSGLLRERAAGAVSLGGFWRRRVRRLLPALALMLLVVGTALLVVRGDAAVGFGGQAVAALLSSGNWWLIATGSDYFAQSTPPVLQNLWSLGVEEQFYVIWPILLILPVRLVPRRAALWVVSLAAASLMWGEVGVAVLGVARAYYGTDTHVFGLLAGAALALRTPERTPRAPAWMPSVVTAPRIAGGALIAVVLLAALLPAESAYTVGSPAAVLLSCAVIVTAERSGPVGAVLSAAPLVAVGRRSYGVYLWHWPVLVLVSQALPVSSPAFLTPLLVVILTAAAAWASWRYVEAPIIADGLRAFWSRLHRGRTGPWRIAPAAVAAVALAATVAGIAVAPTSTAAEQQIAAGMAALAGPGEQGQGAAPSPPVSAAPAQPPAMQAPAADPSAAPATPEPSAPATSPESSKPAPPGTDILAVGDSVMLASSSALVDRFPGIRIDAAVSRMPPEAPAILRALAAAGELRPIVVVGLGTNGVYRADTLDQVRRIIGPERTLVLVNVYADRSWQNDVNDAIAGHAARDRHNVVVNWHDAVAAHPDALGPDGIHPNVAGAQLYADSLARTLAK
jgi:peptidoglycan/LPS O-acetylase OafA/YrhL